jgi:hypothetical protein
MATASRTVKGHVVQTSSDFSTWTTQARIRCDECSEGAGQIVGHASLSAYIGTGRIPGATGAPATMALITGLVGKWVRVLIEESGGSITVGSLDYNPLWHGIIDAERLNDQGGGLGSQEWMCSGLEADLARRCVMDGWIEVTKGDGTKLAGHYNRAPPFNDPRGYSGASTATYSLDGGPAIKLPALGGADLTAKELLQNVLSTHADWWDPATNTWTTMVTWSLTAGTLLDYKAPTIEPQGQTVLDILNFCANPRRGLTWRKTVSGTTCTITILSTAAVAIGSLAAATDTSTPDLTSIWSSDVSLTEDQSATFDRIDIAGGKVWTGLSMAYDPANGTAQRQSLIQGWTAGEETAWSAGTGTINDKVWRTFTVNPKWDGRTYADDAKGMPNGFSLTGSDYTGTRTFTALSTAGIPTALVDATTALPCGEGFTNDLTGPRQDALAFWKAKGSSVWVDLQSSPDVGRQISVDGPPISVSVGSAHHSTTDLDKSQQLQNKMNLETSGVLVVTVGVIEANPLRVSWTRSSGSWPRGIPRTLLVSMPTCEYWQVIGSTVTGVSGGSLTTTANLVMRNDLPKMQAALEFCRAYYAEPARALSWTDRGSIEYAYGSGAPAPGALVTTATLGTGATTINAIITRRTWRLSEESYGTAYQTDRIVPDMDSIR